MESPGMTLVSHGGKAFRFDPGALCLELLTTGGPGEFARYEVLHEPSDLARWADRSRLSPGLELSITQRELERTRSVRDALFLLTADRAHGRPPNARDLAVVNAAAAEPRSPPASSRTAPAPGPPEPRARSYSPRSRATPSTSSPARTPTAFANADPTTATCSSWTHPAPAAAAGAPWNTAATSTRSAPTGLAGTKSFSPSGV